MTQPKVDTSREAVEYEFNAAWAGGEHGRAQSILRALLDAKEAAERERDEARAAAAAAWEAGRDFAAKEAEEAWRDGYNAAPHISSFEPPSDATEALRAVKEAVWEEGYHAGHELVHHENPYAKKYTA